MGYLEIVGWAITRKVNEINGPRPRQAVEGDCKGEDGKEAEEDRGEVVTRSSSIVPYLFSAEAPESDRQQGYGCQVNGMVDEVTVPQLHVLEVHRLQEVWQASPHPNREG